MSLKLIKNEIRRLFSSKLTWAVVLISALAPFCMIIDPLQVVQKSGYFNTMSYFVMLTPAKMGSLVAVMCFSILTLYEMNRTYVKNMHHIIETITNASDNILRKTIALVTAALASFAIAMVFILPATLIKLGGVFDIASFAASWVLIFLPSMIFAILIPAGLYMLIRRFDVSLIIMAVLLILSFKNYIYGKYLLAWVQTNINSFSDATGNPFEIQLITYNRLLWTALSAATYLLGLCCVRRYGKTLIPSFVYNCRNGFVSVLLIISVAGSSVLYANEPYFDKSAPLKYETITDSATGMVYTQLAMESEDNLNLNLVHLETEIEINEAKDRLTGKATYQLQNVNPDTVNQEQPIEIEINPGYIISSLKANGEDVSFIKGDTEQLNSVKYSLTLSPAQETVLEVEYAGSVKESQLFQTKSHGISDTYINLTIAPRLNINNRQAKSSGFITLPENLTPIMPSAVLEKADGKWHYTSDKVANSLYAAEYEKESFRAGGIDINFYYFKRHESIVQEIEAVEIIRDAVDFFADVYGELPYKDKGLSIVELGAELAGGFAKGNTSLVGEVIFLKDGFRPSADNPMPEGGSSADVLVHEIAHQWWGVNTMILPSMGSPWSSEGLTCYSTYLFAKHKYGEAYANKYFIDAWKKEVTRMQNSFYIANPEYAQMLSEDEASNIYMDFNMTTMYSTMSMMLIQAQEALGGETAFSDKLSGFYNAYSSKGPVHYEDFLSFMNLEPEELNVE